MCRKAPRKAFICAAQAGNNGKSHNHNDVGNFLVYADGMPAIIDVGVETYTAKTFSAQRYEIWTMQSAYHNCPTIDGVMQSAGPQFAATEVSYHADDHAAELQPGPGEGLSSRKPIWLLGIEPCGWIEQQTASRSWTIIA